MARSILKNFASVISERGLYENLEAHLLIFAVLMSLTTIMKNTSVPNAIPVTSGFRIEFLDSLRGIAILLVYFHHAFSRWPEVVPYGREFYDVPIFRFGWLGVQLFFLISGFVIFMTLEKSLGRIDFLKRRWLRLFPAMLICSLIIYFSSSLFPFRPSGEIQARDFLPGLTFMEPSWWRVILGAPQGVIEGAFWSLFVEVKFYVIACLVYFKVGRNRLIIVLLVIFVVACALSQIPSISNSQMKNELRSMKQFGWFAAGALFYCYFYERKLIFMWLALAVSFAAAIVTGTRLVDSTVAAFITVILFASAVYLPFMQRILERKTLLVLGALSYPFYLIHENMSISMIVQLHNLSPEIPFALLPLGPLAIVLALAYIIAKYVEPVTRKAIKSIGR